MGKPQKPEYRRREEQAAREQQEAEKHDDNIKIIAAMNRVADEQHAANHEHTPKEKGKRSREIIRICGIYTAAVVALIAILITHWDSSDQIAALSGQLKVMQGQLDAMEADQRPWIKVEPNVGELPVDLTHGVGGLPFHANYKLTNTGHSPAFNVRVAPYSFVPTEGKYDMFAEQHERCEQSRTEPLDNWARGYILFPGDSVIDGG